MDVSLNYELVGYWPMDEGSGAVSTRDDSGWNNTGLLTNITDSNWKGGISGKCIDFNGTDEFIDCSNNCSLDVSGNFSISSWIHMSVGSAGTQYVVIKNHVVFSDCQYAFGCDMTNDKIIGGFNGTLYGGTTNSSIVRGQWYHIVMVYNQTDVRYYIDGVLVGNPHAITDSVTQTDHDVLIAKRKVGTDFFDGQMEDVRIYNRALNTEEIEYLYDNPSGVNKNLVSARLLITDLDGDGHTITDNIEIMNVNTTLSYASDTFEIVLANYDDAYSYIEFGCEIEVLLGVGGINTKRLVGIITDETYTLDDDLIDGRIEIFGEDIGHRLYNIYIFKLIYNTEISDILIDILDTVDTSTGETMRDLAGIDPSNEFIESTTHTSEITKFVWVLLSDVIKQLADYAGYDWYIDTNRKIHFYESRDVSVSKTIVDTDIVDGARIGVYESAVNRAIVFGGYEYKTDQTGSTKAKTYTVTDNFSVRDEFTPTSYSMSSVYVWTEVVLGSESNVVLTIEDASSNIISNSMITVYKDNITDGDYTEFKFNPFINLTAGVEYYIRMRGTTSNGVKIGYSMGNVMDYITKYPVRIMSMSSDFESYEKYGLYMERYVNINIDDPDLAVLKSISMLNGIPKKSAIISVEDDSISVGDVITLNSTKPGILINKNMKVMSSILKLQHSHIVNELELKEV